MLDAVYLQEESMKAYEVIRSKLQNVDVFLSILSIGIIILVIVDVNYLLT